MSGKLFWTIFFAIVSAGFVFLLLKRWFDSEEKRQFVASLPKPREIGFAAVMAAHDAEKA